MLVEAMACGDIVAMIRKGGIREQRSGFDVRHDRFLLYPTYFHEKAAEVADRFRGRLEAAHATRPPEGLVRFTHVAEAAAVWKVEELEPLRGIADLHGLAWPAVESRFHYRQRPGLHVVAVRVLALRAPAQVPEARRYGGCVSWVELDQPVDVAGARPVVDRATLDARVARLVAAFGAPTSAQ